MNLDRRTFLATATAAAAAPRLSAEAVPVFRPEDFGARGDGITNDSDAFTALSKRVNARGGGTISLGPRKTYIVGRQHRGGIRAFTPQPLLEMAGLTRPLIILGNGARLKAAPGLRFGAFDAVQDRPVHRPMPNYREADIASPYVGLIVVRDCRALIAISDVELDGSLPELRIGGPYGDTGWQIAGSGLFLVDNIASETITNVYSHHHGQDGAMIDGDPGKTARSRFSRLVCRSNGRQGLSLIGGRAYDFEDCEFSRTGRSAISSAPGAGVDIEAEGKKTNRDISFLRCKFIDNAGAGIVADSGDSSGVRFADCQFVGTTNWSAWPNKPNFRFERCTFAGTVVHPYPSHDPQLAAQFRDCRFTDDPSRSPTGKLFLPDGPIVNMAESDNVLFDKCKFELVDRGTLPWSWRATYRDCVMRQASPAAAMTKGKYLGTTTITGPVNLYGSMIVGILIVNGRAIPPGPLGVARW
jgi:hypothetical protein